jgi:hypothetical protein
MNIYKGLDAYGSARFHFDTVGNIKVPISDSSHLIDFTQHSLLDAGI